MLPIGLVGAHVVVAGIKNYGKNNGQNMSSYMFTKHQSPSVHLISIKGCFLETKQLRHLFVEDQITKQFDAF